MSSSDVDLNALNYTVLVPYNETIATGGDSLAGDLNIYYQVKLGILGSGGHILRALTVW
jgi:hypothetical protein